MTVKLKCPVCGSMGTVMQKTTKTKTTTGQYKEYRYWYVYHGKKAKKPWCYLGKEDLEKAEIKKAIEELTTQTATQINAVTTQTTNNLKLSLKDKIRPKRHFTHSQKCFQNEALGELNRFFQTTQQNHSALRCFIKNVIAHFISQPSCKVLNFPMGRHVFEP